MSGGVEYKSFRELSVRRRDAVLILQFNRPAVKNALHRRAVFELLRALEMANADSNINVVVLMGNEASFTAGTDLREVLQLQKSGDSALDAHYRSANFVMTSVVKKMLMCRKVIVALVQGICVGVGVTLCALCDVVYATDTAQFWTPFSTLGLCSELGSSWTLPHIVGRSKAAELLLFGARMDAQTALQCGFIAAVLKDEEEFWKRMTEYAKLPAVSIFATKRLLQRPWREEILAATREECIEMDRLRRGKHYRSQLNAFARRQNISKL